MWDFVLMLLHAAAYFGVWLLNVLIYETIAVAIWLPVSLYCFNSKSVSERTGDLVTCRLGLALLALIFILAMAFWLTSWVRIIPLPVFT